MKISTKGRYALRLMLDLALNNTGEAVSLKDIARRQDISDKYLEQIISILNKAGYVRSIRGAQGGYMLRRPPKEYTVGMILRLTEGTLAPVSCVEDDAVECEREASCVTFIGKRLMMPLMRLLTILHWKTWWNGITAKVMIMLFSA